MCRFYYRIKLPGTACALHWLQPSSRTGELRKLAGPFHGPYRIISLDTNTAHVRRVDQPQDELILVAIDRLRRCPDELEEGCWPPKATGRGRRKMRREAVQRTAGDTTPTPGETPQMTEPPTRHGQRREGLGPHRWLQRGKRTSGGDGSGVTSLNKACLPHQSRTSDVKGEEV